MTWRWPAWSIEAPEPARQLTTVRGLDDGPAAFVGPPTNAPSTRRGASDFSLQNSHLDAAARAKPPLPQLVRAAKRETYNVEDPSRGGRVSRRLRPGGANRQLGPGYEFRPSV